MIRGSRIEFLCSNVVPYLDYGGDYIDNMILYHRIISKIYEKYCIHKFVISKVIHSLIKSIGTINFLNLVVHYNAVRYHCCVTRVVATQEISIRFL